MKTIYITEEIRLRKIDTKFNKWYFKKYRTQQSLQSQQFKTKESALYHLCTNQIIWS